MRAPDVLARSAVTIAVFAIVGTITPSVAAASSPKSARQRAGHTRAVWTLRTFFTEPITVAGEGVASYLSGQALFRGFAEVPASIRQLGFNHVGDEDIDRSGHIYDAYEDDHPNPVSKLFTITAPNGRVSEYRHPLARGEEFNNSFVTVSPNERWLVSGEWDTEHRLLLLANPKGRPSGSSIPLAGTIVLRPSLYHVQGCDFFGAVTLICSTDNAVHAVVKVSLSAPLHRGTNRATDRQLLIPRQVSKCPGTGFESEGVDYNARTGRLTLGINEPGTCVVTTDINVYTLAHRPRGPAIGTPLANGTPMPAGSTVGGQVTFTVPVDSTAAGGRATTTITLSRRGHPLASNRHGGRGTRTGANPTLMAPMLADGTGYVLRIVSVGANGRSARSRFAFAVKNPSSSIVA